MGAQSIQLIPFAFKGGATLGQGGSIDPPAFCGKKKLNIGYFVDKNIYIYIYITSFSNTS